MSPLLVNASLCCHKKQKQKCTVNSRVLSGNINMFLKEEHRWEIACVLVGFPLVILFIHTSQHPETSGPRCRLSCAPVGIITMKLLPFHKNPLPSWLKKLMKTRVLPFLFSFSLHSWGGRIFGGKLKSGAGNTKIWTPDNLGCPEHSLYAKHCRWLL